MMKTEIKQKWIDALVSGKYEQGSEKLRSLNGFCCLGVLCDIYAKENDKEWDFRTSNETAQLTDYWYFDEQSEFLPDSVMNWAEINSKNPQVKVYFDDQTGNDYFYHEEIANLNDSGYNFKELAKIIEKQF